VSKAAVKALTESLAHSLIPTSVTAHLLVPGYTFTKLTSGGASAIDGVKPSAAWTGEQVAQELVKRMEKEFYILCPDSKCPLFLRSRFQIPGLSRILISSDLELCDFVTVLN
jgi:NAD(P)-dependent dehydrogenase (short-subunit alcohol dehydrogenase family)